MGMFPKTQYAWKRFKLLLAQFLLRGFSKGDHTGTYHATLSDAMIMLHTFRETYFPAVPSNNRNGERK